METDLLNHTALIIDDAEDSTLIKPGWVRHDRV